MRGLGAKFLEMASLLYSFSKFVQDVSGIERFHFCFWRLRPSYFLICLHFAIIEQGQLIDSFAASRRAAIHNLLLLKNQLLEGHLPLHLIVDSIEMRRHKYPIRFLPNLRPKAYLIF